MILTEDNEVNEGDTILDLAEMRPNPSSLASEKKSFLIRVFHRAAF
jgi:hypothetical protein